MSKPAPGPRIQIYLFQQGSEGRVDTLIDSAVDPVLEWNYRDPEGILTLRVMDQNGNVAQAISKYSLSEFVTQSLATDFATKLPNTPVANNLIHEALIEDLPVRVEYRISLGDRQDSTRYGIIISYKALNGTDDNSVVELIIAPGEPYKADKKFVELGVTTKDSGHEYSLKGSYFGQVERKGADFGYRQVYKWRRADVINHAERLLGIPATNKPIRRNAVVVFPDSIYDTLYKHLGNIDKAALPGYALEKLRMSLRDVRIGSTRQLGLAINYDKFNEADVNSSEFRAYPLEVLLTLTRLRDITDRLGVVTKWTVLQITDSSWIDIMAPNSEFRMMYLFVDTQTAQEFSSGLELTKATKSDNAKALMDFVPALNKAISKKWDGVDKEGLARLIDGNKVMVFRAGVKNPNVLSITESQDNGSADIGLLQGSISLIKRAAFRNAPTYPGTDLTVLTEDSWDSIMNQFAASLATNIRGRQEAQDFLVSQGYTFTDDSDLALENQINEIVDNTLTAMMGYKKDPAALAAYLNFILVRQQLGGDTISVKVPLQVGNVIDSAYRNLALLQYAKSPSTGEQLVFDGQLLSGWYEIISSTHTVTSNDAYSTYDMVKRGIRLEVDPAQQPIEGDEPDPDPVEEDVPEEEEAPKPFATNNYTVFGGF